MNQPHNRLHNTTMNNDVVTVSDGGASTPVGSSTIDRVGSSARLGDGNNSVSTSASPADGAFHLTNIAEATCEDPHEMMRDDGGDTPHRGLIENGSGALFYNPIRRVFSTLELLGLFSVSFSYAFVFNTINNIVIPKEVERLTQSRQSMWVGMIMAAGAVSQLSTPIVGAWSDRHGSRTPFLIYGTFATILGIVIFLVVGSLNDITVLFCAHVVATVGLSVQYSMVTALLNDHVTEEQQGLASGCMAILAILGSGAGYAMFATNMPLYYSYCSYILATVMALGICIAFVPGAEPSSGGTSFPETNPKARSKKQSVANCVDTTARALSVPSPTLYPDFFYACLGRGLFNTGLAGQVYLVYYLRDVLSADNPVAVTSTVAVMALLGGIVGALPSGYASDRVGKKPVIYASVLVCLVSVLLFLVVGGVSQIQLVGFVYGVGNVAYLSVDYALGVQSLPRRPATDDADDKRLLPIDAAKDLGIFAMSATVGQLFGQVLYGAVLDQFGHITATGSHYEQGGFVVVYGLAALCFLGSGISTAFVRGVK